MATANNLQSSQILRRKSPGTLHKLQTIPTKHSLKEKLLFLTLFHNLSWVDTDY